MKRIHDKQVVGYLVFEGIEIENANALSGNLLYGTPALTGIKGAFHAMSRKIMTDKATARLNAQLSGVMIACHDYKVYAARSDNYKEYRFSQQKPSVVTRPDLEKLKSGILPSVIEQAYCYVKMSFVVEVLSTADFSSEDKACLVKSATSLIQRQRIAGGNIRHSTNQKQVSFLDANNLDLLAYRLPKCYILTDASALMSSLLGINPDSSSLDILIDVCSTHHVPQKDSWGRYVWNSSHDAYLVPITVGYHGISERFKSGVLKNSRTSDYPCQYVESIYGLGEWVDPHKLRLNNNFSAAFWYYEYQSDTSLYLMTTNPDH